MGRSYGSGVEARSLSGARGHLRAGRGTRVETGRVLQLQRDYCYSTGKPGRGARALGDGGHFPLSYSAKGWEGRRTRLRRTYACAPSGTATRPQPESPGPPACVASMNFESCVHGFGNHRKEAQVDSRTPLTSAIEPARPSSRCMVLWLWV